MRSCLPLALAATMSSATLTATLADDSVPLRWKFKVGDSIAKVVTYETETNVPDLIDRPATSRVIFDIRCHVKGMSPSGGYILELAFDRIRAEEQITGVTISFDSLQPKDEFNLAAEILLSLAKHPISIEVTGAGQVRSLTIPEPVKVAIARFRHVNVSVRPNAGVLGREQLAQLVYALFPRLPDGMVTKGSTWTQSFSEPLGMSRGSLTTKIVFTLAGWDAEEGRQSANIAAAYAFKHDRNRNDDAIEFLSSSATGTVRFDTDVGQLVESARTSTWRFREQDHDVELKQTVTVKPATNS